MAGRRNLSDTACIGHRTSGGYNITYYRDNGEENGNFYVGFRVQGSGSRVSDSGSGLTPKLS